MATFDIIWKDKEVEKHVEGEVMKRLDKSGFIVAGAVKEVITQKGLIDTGLYRADIKHVLFPDRLTVRIGSGIGDLANPQEDPPYPLYLEVGTIHIPAHAPIRIGLSNSKSRLNSVWGAGMVTTPSETGEERIISLPSIRR